MRRILASHPWCPTHDAVHDTSAAPFAKLRHRAQADSPSFSPVRLHVQGDVEALMSLARLTYTILLSAITPLALLRLAWRARRQPEYLRHVGERFGMHPPQPDAPVIWIHAVSVGETHAAQPLVHALRAAHPRHRILLTHTTPTGRRTGEQLFGDTVLRAYLPYDLPWAVRRFLRAFRPQAGVLMETELWPNLLAQCRRARIPVVLLNARMSERSARGYARIGRLSREAMAALSGVGAQTQADAQRIAALGAHRVEVTGNLKFDRSPTTADLALGQVLRARFGGRFVFLAASTREGEEEQVLDALEGMDDDTLLALVPRHPQRFEAVAALLAKRGIAFQRRSDGQPVRHDARVWLGDSMGELFACYAACDVAFVGGSLLPLGGQNLLEALAVGRPVVVGPHTYNFAQATESAVDAGAALRVADAGELRRAVTALRSDPEGRRRMGEAGLAFMQRHSGATARTLALVESAMAKRP